MNKENNFPFRNGDIVFNKRRTEFIYFFNITHNYDDIYTYDYSTIGRSGLGVNTATTTTDKFDENYVRYGNIKDISASESDLIELDCIISSGEPMDLGKRKEKVAREVKLMFLQSY